MSGPLSVTAARGIPSRFLFSYRQCLGFCVMCVEVYVLFKPSKLYRNVVSYILSGRVVPASLPAGYTPPSLSMPIFFQKASFAMFLGDYVSLIPHCVEKG